MWSILVGSAFAQTASEPSEALTGIDAHGLSLVALDADARDPLAVQRPGAFDGGDFFVSFLAEYATDLLVQDRVTVGTTTQIIPDNIAAGNLSFGVALHERVRLDVAAPVYGFTFGDEGALGGPAMGDVRTTLLLVPARPARSAQGGGFGFGLVGHVDAPLGPPERSLGRGAVGAGGRLAFTYEFPRVTLTGDLGAELNPDVLGAVHGSTDALRAGLALGLQPVETFGITLEAHAAPSLWETFDGNFRKPPAEALVSMRYAAPTGALLTIGGALEIWDGPGVAAYRVFFGSGFGRHRVIAVRDIDVLGVLHTTDLCPTEVESVNGWKDDDGCPDQLGTLQIDVKFAGQSRSADAEIIGASGRQALRIGPQGLSIDAVPGTQWTVLAMDGCLSGQAEAEASSSGTPVVVNMEPHYDANVVIDVVGPGGLALTNATVRWRSDRPECMPAEAATVDATGRVAQAVGSGRHTLVVTAPQHNVVEQAADIATGENRAFRVQLEASKIVVETRQIRILEKVQFESGKAVLRTESYALLNQVAAVLLANPGIGRVEVGGHTDNKGTEEANLDLSSERAMAVVIYLAAQGVPREQLVARGFGESLPIDTNRTEGGREANRRVEFKLLDAPRSDGPPASPGGPS